MRFRRIQADPHPAHDVYRAGVPRVTQSQRAVAELAGLEVYDSVDAGSQAGVLPDTAGSPSPRRDLLPRGMP